MGSDLGGKSCQSVNNLKGTKHRSLCAIMGFSVGAAAPARPLRCPTPRRAAPGAFAPFLSRRPALGGLAGSEPRLVEGAFSLLATPSVALILVIPGSPRGWLRGRVPRSAPRRPAPHPRRHEGPGRPRLAPRPARCPPGAPLQARRQLTCGPPVPQRKEAKFENETLPSGELPRKDALLFGGSRCSLPQLPQDGSAVGGRSRSALLVLSLHPWGEGPASLGEPLGTCSYFY